MENKIGELNSQILDFTKHIANQSKVVAIALINNYSANQTSGRVVYEVLSVIHNFAPKLMSYIKTVNDKTIFLFTVDQWIFERDIEKGFLGEALAGKLIFPYQPILGKAYLHDYCVKLKKRLVLELLENLVASFPELVSRMHIMPQYFLYEILSTRIRVFPLLAYDWAELTNHLLENEKQALIDYNEAIEQLTNEGKIGLSNGSIIITKKFMDQSQNPKVKILNLAKNAPRAFFSSVLGVLPQLLNIISQNTEEFLRTQKISRIRQFDPSCIFVDPQKYVLFPTGDNLVSLADRTNIERFAEKMIQNKNGNNLEIRRLGGLLNDVYLVEAIADGREIKVLAKRFKDWSGFKWFPLTLWSFGARTFSVSGQARLAKECAISDLLRIKGFNVPRILHVSNSERLVFMEYIEGENLSQAVKLIASAGNDEKNGREMGLIRKAGGLMAQVHSHNIALGDTKPDNTLISPDGKLYLIDFEQASQDGDKAWDIAVFLYYCGHYLQPIYSREKAQAIAKAFIDGYLKWGGRIEDIRKVGSPKYQRVFSIFTMPTIMRSISNTCKNA